MRNEPEYFSVYGGGYQQARHEGMQAFKAGLPKRAAMAAWSVVAVLLVSGLTMAAQAVIPTAEAGAKFARHAK